MKRFLLITLASVCLLFSNTGSAHAAIDEVTQHQQALEACLLNDSVNLECQSSMTFKQGTAVPIMLGILGGEPQVISDANGNKKIVYSKGLVGDMSTQMAWLFINRPASTHVAVADFLQTAGIAQPAYAQGIGFASLSPVLETWKKFRNIAYLFFVLIFIAIGFMIMLRQKVGGQTAVTAQQAIPNVIVALLFVTFSYAIAGLLIDFMYVLMFFMIGLFGKEQGQFIGMNFLVLGFKMVVAGGTSAFEVINSFSTEAINSLGDIGLETVEFLSGLTMGVVVAIAIALNVFRLFFELLKTYVIIVLNVVFAPVLLMLGAIPGKNTFGAWVKNLVGNLAAFPAVLLVLIVFDELTGGISGKAAVIEEGGFLPPYLFGRSESTSVAGALSFAVGLGSLMIMPEIVKKVKETLGAKGGIFEQFAGDIASSLKRGWEGGKPIPGLGLQLPGARDIGKTVGVGGAAVGGGAVTGGLVARHARTPADAPYMFGAGFKAGFPQTGARVAKALNAKNLFPKAQKDLDGSDDKK